MTIRLLTAVAVAFAASQVPAAAQAPDADALRDVARCAIAKDRRAAVATAGALPFTGDEVRVDAAGLGRGAACLKHGAVAAPAMALRGAFAEALYRADFVEPGLEPERATGTFANLRLPAIDGDVSADTAATLFKFGDCIARNDATSVGELIRTRDGSSAEKILLDRLQPYFAACYPQGATLSLKRATLRSVLAQSAYRVSQRYWDGQLRHVAASE